jgi:uncharacterized 2Fe-2S/4Fe-4S cluster protein (DUF4445 family)
VAGEAGAVPQDILALTLVGNPIMHHLVLGLDPTELGGAPFALATDQSIEQPASALGIEVLSPESAPADTQAAAERDRASAAP